MLARIILAGERTSLLGGQPQLARQPRDAKCGGKRLGEASPDGAWSHACRSSGASVPYVAVGAFA